MEQVIDLLKQVVVLLELVVSLMEQVMAMMQMENYPFLAFERGICTVCLKFSDKTL